MTNESRRAFEEWHLVEFDQMPEYKTMLIYDCHANNLFESWKTSKSSEQARILALLDSEGMAVIIAQAIYDNSSFDFKEQAIAAIEAIKQRIGE